MARFAQAISRTSPTARLQYPNRAAGVADNRVLQRLQLERVVLRARGMLRRDMALRAERRSPQLSRKTFSSVWAACGVTPSFSRPMTFRQ